MAFTANSWHLVTLHALTDPSWPTPLPTLAGPLVSRIAAGTNVNLFCVNADVNGDGLSALVCFRFAGSSGTAVIPHATATVLSLPTTEVTDEDDGGKLYSMRPGDGSWLYYDTAVGLARRVVGPTGLGTFLS